MLVLGAAAVLVTAALGTWVSLRFAIDATARGNDLARQLRAASTRQAFDAHAAGHNSPVIRFLESVPEEERGWAWRFLDAQVRDTSLLVVDDPRLIESNAPEVQRHTVAVDPSGTLVAICGKDGRVVVRNLDDGAVEREWTTHESGTSCVAWSADGERLVVGGGDGWIRVIDATNGDVQREFQVPPQAESGKTSLNLLRLVAFGPGPDEISAIVGWPTFQLWIYDTRTWKRRYASDYQIARSGFAEARPGHPDSLLVGQYFHERTPGSQPVPLESKNGACAGGWSRRGAYAVTGCLDGVVEVWEPTGGRVASTIAHGGHVLTVATSADERLIASGGADGLVRILDRDGARVIGTLTGHREAILHVEFLEDGRLMSASYDGTLRVWSLETLDRAESYALPPEAGRMMSVAFAPDPDDIVMTGSGIGCSLLDTSDGSIERLIEKHGYPRHVVLRPGPTNDLAVASDNLKVILRSDDGSTVELDTEKYPSRLAYSPDGAWLFAADFAGQVTRWNADDGAVEWRVPAHERSLLALSLSPGGERITVAGDSGVVLLLDSGDGSIIAQRDLGRSVLALAHLERSERWAAACQDGVVRILDAESLEVLGEWDGLAGSARAVTVTPTDGHLLVGHATGVINVWSPSGEELGTIPCFEGAVHGLAIDATGSRLVAIGRSDRVRLWRLETD